MSELVHTFEALQVGDEISVPQYTNPLTVVEVGEFTVELEGQRSGKKSLTQNYHDETRIALTVGAKSKGVVDEIVVVNRDINENDEDDDSEEVKKALAPSRSNPRRPMKTNADVFESVARVMVHDTGASNETVRIHVEHAEHDGGVCSFLCYSRDEVAARVEKHLSQSIVSELADVELNDDAGVGLSESQLLGRKEMTANQNGVSA